MSTTNDKKRGFSRRKFLVRGAVGVGVLLGAGYFTRGLWRRELFEFVDAGDFPYMGNTDTPPVWFEVLVDNQIRLHSPKVEMGQGVLTGLAQIAADELDVDIEQIQVVHAATNTGNVDLFATGGSTSIRSLWVPIRELAATMREMLKNEAAKLLGVSPEQLETASGMITAGDRTMTYGEVAAGVEEWDIPDVPPLRAIEAYRYVGKPVPRVDLADKVYGAPIFGMDATLPEMLYGAVVYPSRIGAEFKNADTSRAAGMPGVVKVVTEEDFVGVVATSRMAAEHAKKVIEVEWATERNWQSEDIVAMLEVGNGNPVTIQKAGDAEDLLEGEEDLITAEYRSPIGAHAQLEPCGSVAHVTEDGATVILSTQVAEITRKEVADRLGLKKKEVNIVPTFLGGGFGRRLHTPNAMHTALLSKAVGKPVKCFCNRKEAFQNDTFRPPTHHVLKAKLSADGLIEAIEHHVASGDVMFGSALTPGFADPIMGADAGAWRGGMFQYRAIPNFRAVSWRVKLPFATSWWRSLGLLANTFAIESFMDELAVAADKDPVQFRLDQIQDDKAGSRLRAVIEKAAERSGWQKGVAEGRALGFAASTDAETPCAHVVEASIVAGEIKVHKVTCVMDPGLVVNPDQVRAQCEGAIIMGLSAALYEQMHVVDGALTPTIYGPYRMALMKDAPKTIDVVLLENDQHPGAVGEPPMGPIGAAIANAVFRLTGQRLREMPLQKALS